MNKIYTLLFAATMFGFVACEQAAEAEEAVVEETTEVVEEAAPAVEGAADASAEAVAPAEGL